MTFDRAVLPPWLNRLDIRELTVANARGDLSVTRGRYGAAVEVVVVRWQVGELVEPGNCLWTHQRVVVKRHPEGRASVVEPGRFQVGGPHRLPHGFDPAAAVLDDIQPSIIRISLVLRVEGSSSRFSIVTLPNNCSLLSVPSPFS